MIFVLVISFLGFCFWFCRVGYVIRMLIALIGLRFGLLILYTYFYFGLAVFLLLLFGFRLYCFKGVVC